ncbi:MAG: hypothetical protein QOG04_2189 [Actinomycetota bacterium]|jgi:hypothetical protein|nr:hypothetical protein [Actinomycetota bacterium]
MTAGSTVADHVGKIVEVIHGEGTQPRPFGFEDGDQLFSVGHGMTFRFGHRCLHRWVFSA